MSELGFTIIKMDKGHKIPSPTPTSDERNLFLKVYSGSNIGGLCITDTDFQKKAPDNEQITHGTEYIAPGQWTIISDRRIARGTDFRARVPGQKLILYIKMKMYLERNII